jgi:hypothetical protein
LEVTRSVAELTSLRFLYDIDFFYNMEGGKVPEHLQDLKSVFWRGRNQWGPFGTNDKEAYEGLLRWEGIERHESYGPVVAEWDSPSQLDLFRLAHFGARLKDLHETHPSTRTTLVDVEQFATFEQELGSVQASRVYVHSQGQVLDGLRTVDPGSSEDLVNYWNHRATGSRVIPIPTTGTLTFEQATVILNSLRRDCPKAPDSNEREIRYLWRPEESLTPLADVLHDAADFQGVELRDWNVSPLLLGHISTLKTKFKRSYEIEVPYGTMRARVPIPSLTLLDQPVLQEYFTGLVAADISTWHLRGQDPRLTAWLPDHPEQSALVTNALTFEDAKQGRASRNGVVVGVKANANEAPIQLCLKTEAFRVLFGGDVEAGQSDAGLFQTRAAEMLGGAAAGVLNQPGVAAALKLLAHRTNGVRLQQLKSEIYSNRGEWPAPLWNDLSPGEYANQELNRLLNSPLVVPVFDVKCTFCGVVSQYEPARLAPVVSCDFCGQDVRLALSLNLTKGAWRYRLAGHLPSDKAQAMIPVLATLGVIQALTHTESGAALHVLGLEVKYRGRQVEADIAAYIRDPLPVALLAEVKSANYVQDEDIANLEYLQDILSDKNKRSMLVFSTAKDRFGPEEVLRLRSHCERRARHEPLGQRGSATRLPLLLTGRDLALSSDHEGHPWRWSERYGEGIFGTALESCRRNLGLTTCQALDAGFELHWDQDAGKR